MTFVKTFAWSFLWLLAALQVHAYLQQPATPQQQPIAQTGIIASTGTIEETGEHLGIPKEPKIICHGVCNGNNDLVQYAYDISSGDMDFILTITHESKRNRKAQGAWWEDGLCQWTDFWKEWKASKEFANPNRQIDKCREQYQWWLAGGAIERQLVGYKYRMKRADNFEIVYQ